MPAYEHYQELKKAEALPQAEGEIIGACITCKYWQVETPRSQAMTTMVGLCVQEHLKPFALIVTGASACNKWQEQPGAGPEAKTFAELGEEK